MSDETAVYVTMVVAAGGGLTALSAAVHVGLSLVARRALLGDGLLLPAGFVVMTLAALAVRPRGGRQ